MIKDDCFMIEKTEENFFLYKCFTKRIIIASIFNK